MCIRDRSTSTKDRNEKTNRASNIRDFDKDKETENASRYKYTNALENGTKEEMISVRRLHEEKLKQPLINIERKIDALCEV